jgi:hypothetical protein
VVRSYQAHLSAHPQNSGATDHHDTPTHVFKIVEIYLH